MGRRRARVSRDRKIMRNTMLMILLVVCILFVALFIGGYRLNKKIDAALATKSELEAEINDEKTRKEELEELEDYMQTDEYIREVAREKLGLVDEGDIIFRRDDDNK
ncbi:MAG: septum formation initiator family protein [Lachnospiraceae bacterium]|jgi:cell division protein DivIC|nr:septum formation initiator family protein [Lachnospiraceae bacterium]